MNNVFTQNCLYVGIKKNSEGNIIVSISSDYAHSERKGRLFTNPTTLATMMEQEWEKLKTITRKITKFSLYFDEIDWYDSHCNVYDTPVIILEKGKTKAKISSQEHGSIPKDWSVNVKMIFEGVKQKKVILESIKCVLGYYYSKEIEKVIEKTNEVLNGKKDYISYYN